MPPFKSLSPLTATRLGLAARLRARRLGQPLRLRSGADGWKRSAGHCARRREGQLAVSSALVAPASFFHVAPPQVGPGRAARPCEVPPRFCARACNGEHARAAAAPENVLERSQKVSSAFLQKSAVLHTKKGAPLPNLNPSGFQGVNPLESMKKSVITL